MVLGSKGSYLPKGKVVVQPPFFRGELLDFRGVQLEACSNNVKCVEKRFQVATL